MLYHCYYYDEALWELRLQHCSRETITSNRTPSLKAGRQTGKLLLQVCVVRELLLAVKCVKHVKQIKRPNIKPGLINPQTV